MINFQNNPKCYIKGDKGSQGDVGPRGMIGMPGLPGFNGCDGKNGHNGLKGDRGCKGVIGKIGLTGEKGNKGDRGSDYKIVFKNMFKTPSLYSFDVFKNSYMWCHIKENWNKFNTNKVREVNSLIVYNLDYVKYIFFDMSSEKQNYYLNNIKSSYKDILKPLNTNIVNDSNIIDSNFVVDTNTVDSNLVNDSNNIDSNIVNDTNNIDSNMENDSNIIDSNMVIDSNSIDSNVVNDTNIIDLNDSNVNDSNFLSDTHTCVISTNDIMSTNLNKTYYDQLYAEYKLNNDVENELKDNLFEYFRKENFEYSNLNNNIELYNCKFKEIFYKKYGSNFYNQYLESLIDSCVDNDKKINSIDIYNYFLTSDFLINLDTYYIRKYESYLCKDSNIESEKIICKDDNENFIFIDHTYLVNIDFVPDNIDESLLKLYNLISGQNRVIERGTLVVQILDPLSTIYELSLKYGLCIKDFRLAPSDIYIINHINPMSRFFSTLVSNNMHSEESGFFIKDILYKSSYIEGYFDSNFDKFEISIKYIPREDIGIPSIFHGNLIENNRNYAFDSKKVNIKQLINSSEKKDYSILILNSGICSK